LFLSSFSFLIWFFWVFPCLCFPLSFGLLAHLLFLELANTTAGISFYCQSCDRTQYGLMYDVDIHPMLGTDISEDAMVAHHYRSCCC
jgi:glucan phosphoethanolaminetransferase (alkaline phosphatase superfamily)